MKMKKEEMDFAKKVFGKILDLNLRDDGIIYQPRVGLHIGGGYLISCYLKEKVTDEGEFVPMFGGDEKKFFEEIDRCAKRLLEQADVNKGIRIKKLEEELESLKKE
jgi:hypothetical protein